MTTGHSEWTSDTNDNSGQNASLARNPSAPRVRRNQAETGGQWSNWSPGKPSTAQHYSSGGQWIAETGQNSKEWSAVDDWSAAAVRHSPGRHPCPGGQTETTRETSSKERSAADNDQDVFRSPGSTYGRCGPPPPPPRRLSHSFVRDTAKVFDAQPQTLDASSRQHLVAARRVSMPGELRRPHSSSPARTVRLSSFLGHGPADDGTEGEFHGHPSAAAKLNLFRSPVRLPRYTQDLATGIYATFNRPDLQDQWLNVTDVQTMRDALALQREIAAKESNAAHHAAKSGAPNKSSSGTVGVRCMVIRSTISSSSSSSDEDSSSESGDSQTTILRAPKQSQNETKP